MTISQRLTRAGLTFIIVGTVAAVLPQQDNTAADAGGCSSNPSYSLIFATSGSGTTDTSSFKMSVAPNVTTGKVGSANLVFPMIKYVNGGTTTYRKISDASFTAYNESISFNSAGPGSINGGSGTQTGVTPGTAPANGAGAFMVTSGNGYALDFTESVAGTSGSFTDTVTITDSTNGNANVTLSETASLTG